MGACYLAYLGIQRGLDPVAVRRLGLIFVLIALISDGIGAMMAGNKR